MLEEQGEKPPPRSPRRNGAAIYGRLDVTSEAEWQAAMDATVAAYGKLDILVNDAGSAAARSRILLDSEAWQRIMAVTATAPFSA